MTARSAAPLHRGRRRVRLLRVLVLAMLVPLALATGAGLTATLMLSRLQSYEEVPLATLSEAARTVAIDLAGENPRFAADPPLGPVPLCRDVPENAIKPLRLAFGYMRGTDEGRRLYELLLEHDICVRLEPLAFNAAYASVKLAFPDDWSASEIVVDQDLVRSGLADVLAAVLVHEATHLRRAIDGDACFLTDDCELLPNGVPVEEEVAAHAAEAEWWIAAFGRDGKRFAIRADQGLNNLAEAYLDGSDRFRAYVVEIRSDPREGTGF